MAPRTDKGRALARYLTGKTGIPFLSWNGPQSQVDAPFPYKIEVTTSRKLQNWHDLIREDSPQNLEMKFVIRYDNGMESLEHAWVGMQLHTFVQLLQDNYQARYQGRGEE